MVSRIERLLSAIKFSLPTVVSWIVGIVVIAFLFNQLNLSSKLQTIETLISEVFHAVFQS